MPEMMNARIYSSCQLRLDKWSAKKFPVALQFVSTLSCRSVTVAEYEDAHLSAVKILVHFASFAVLQKATVVLTTINFLRVISQIKFNAWGVVG